MKKPVIAIVLSLPLLLTGFGCSQVSKNENSDSAPVQNFVSEKVNGKYTLDRATSEELKVMENTVVNFSLMIKRQPKNLAAYNEYGNLLENHIARINKYCGLDENTKTELCKNLNLIHEKVPMLQQNDAATAAQAGKDIDLIFSKIDSAFAFSY